MANGVREDNDWRDGPNYWAAMVILWEKIRWGWPPNPLPCGPMLDELRVGNKWIQRLLGDLSTGRFAQLGFHSFCLLAGLNYTGEKREP